MEKAGGNAEFVHCSFSVSWTKSINDLTQPHYFKVAKAGCDNRKCCKIAFSRAGNRTPTTAVRAPDPNHQTTRDMHDDIYFAVEMLF